MEKLKVKTPDFGAKAQKLENIQISQSHFTSFSSHF